MEDKLAEFLLKILRPEVDRRITDRGGSAGVVRPVAADAFSDALGSRRSVHPDQAPVDPPDGPPASRLESIRDDMSRKRVVTETILSRLRRLETRACGERFCHSNFDIGDQVDVIPLMDQIDGILSDLSKLLESIQEVVRSLETAI